MAEDPNTAPVAPPALNDLARAIMAEILTPQNLQKLAKNSQNVALETAKDANELAWKLAAFLPILLAKFALGVMHGGEAEFDELAKVAVDGLFSDGGVRHGHSKEFTATVSAKILEVLTNGAKTIEPNEDAARHFLDAATHLEIEGWLIGYIGELSTAVFGHLGIQKLEHFGKLKDGIAKAMGLSRLSRRVFGPYVDTFITTPTRQALNRKFQPHGLTPHQAVTHYFRGFISYEDMHEVLLREGLNERAIEALQYDTRKYFSVADAYLLTRVGKWDRGQALEHLRESGLEGDQAELELQLADAKDLRQHQERVLADAVAAYVDGQIDLRALDNEIDHGGLDDISKQRHRADALRKRELHAKHLTLAQAEQAVELEVWGITDYRAWLDRVGYAHDDAITLELMLLAKLARLDDVKKQRAQAVADRAATKAAHLQELAAKRQAVALEHADFTGTLAQAERLVVRGEMDPARYRQVLIDHGLSADDAGALTELAGAAATEYAAAQEKRRQLAAQAERQQLPLATLEQAVTRGRLSIDAFRAELVDRKFTAEDAQLLVGVLTDEIAHQAAAEQSRTAAAARLAVKHLSLAQEETAVRQGVKTLTDYQAFLAGQGFSSGDAATLLALLESKLIDDLRAEQLHDRVADDLERSHLSLAQEETAVKDGVKSIDDYAGFLASHGYTADDVETLTTLLTLKLGLT